MVAAFDDDNDEMFAISVEMDFPKILWTVMQPHYQCAAVRRLLVGRPGFALVVLRSWAWGGYRGKGSQVMFVVSVVELEVPLREHSDNLVSHHFGHGEAGHRCK